MTGEAGSSLDNLFNQSQTSGTSLEPAANAGEAKQSEEPKAPTEATEAAGSFVDAVVSEYKLVHDRLHEELAAHANGRTEDNIGLKDPYWDKLNEIRMHIHNNK